MTDKHNKNTGDDEYQFPSEEYGADESAEQSVDSDAQEEQQHDDEQESHYAASPSLADRFPVLRNKRIMMGVGIVIVAIVGVKLMAGGHTKVIKQPVHKAVVQKPVIAQPNPAFLGQLKQLKRSSQGDQTTISQLKAQVEQLQNSLDSSNSENTQLSYSLQTLTNQVKSLSAEVKKSQQHHKKKVVKKPAPEIHYNLIAVVPGRAWIESSTGSSITVRVGDKVKDYGTVRAVNTSRGMVLTSSGKVIEYGVDDS